MKKGLILASAYWYPPTVASQCKRIKAELELLGAEADIRRNDGFLAVVENGNIAAATDGYDFCVYLDKDKYVSLMLERAGLRLFNSHAAIEACDDKMTTHVLLAGQGISMPKTVPGLLCYNENASVGQKSVLRVESMLGYPLVAKASYGSLGKAVYKIDDRTSLEAAMASLKCTPHLFQEYIAESVGRDVRVIVIGGKAVGGMLRSSSGDFRSNIGLGGNGAKFELTDEFIRPAEKTAAILGLDYCAVDFLLGRDAPMLCEVNSNAFFEGFEKATGVNVARTYAEYILNNCGKTH